MVMYSCTKIQSIWRTSDFETKFAQKKKKIAQKNMADKDFQKITIKIIISIEQCTPVSNFN